MAYEFKTIDTVDFNETDMAGIVHYSNYFRYMERVEHAFFRSLNLSVHPRGEALVSGWPRVDARFSYFSPLRFEDRFEAHLIVTKKTRKALTYHCRITCMNDGTPILAAFGRLTTIYVTIKTDNAGDNLSATDMPDIVFDRIACAPDATIAAHENGASDRPQSEPDRNQTI